MLGRLSIITTDLFPKLAQELRAGNIAATIYQRPRTQGRLAFQVLYSHLAGGRTPPHAQVTLVPHLVMRGNLDFFLQRQSLESSPQRMVRLQNDSPELVDYFG